MKLTTTKTAFITIITVILLSSCRDKANTGNGSMDTGIKEGSGYSDSLSPGKGQYDRSTTPNDSKKNNNM